MKVSRQFLPPCWDRDPLDSSWLLPTFPPLGPLLLILGGRGPGAFAPIIFSPVPRGRDIFATLLPHYAVLILIRPWRGSRWLLPGLWTMGGRGSVMMMPSVVRVADQWPSSVQERQGGTSPPPSLRGYEPGKEPFPPRIRDEFAGVQVSLLWRRSHE